MTNVVFVGEFLVVVQEDIYVCKPNLVISDELIKKADKEIHKDIYLALSKSYFLDLKQYNKINIRCTHFNFSFIGH